MTRQQLQSGKYCPTLQNWPPVVTFGPLKSLGPFGYEKSIDFARCRPTARASLFRTGAFSAPALIIQRSLHMLPACGSDWYVGFIPWAWKMASQAAVPGV